MARPLPPLSLSVALVALLPACTRQRMATVDPSSQPAIAAGPTTVDLPCEAASVLATYCWTCHGAVPSGDAPMSLVTWSDLTAPSLTDPTLSMAEEAVLRMQDPTTPMPPPPATAVSATDLAAFQAWVDGGAAQGSCQVSDPFGVPAQCSSGQTWQGGGDEDGSSRMLPGEACIACHTRDEGPRFTYAGTVYPTGHEPDDCLGLGGIQVVLTGPGGQTVTLTANSSGNFSTRTSVGYPYTAKVIQNGKERVMSTPQTTGDCNTCHTQGGLNGAPGRIVAP